MSVARKVLIVEDDHDTRVAYRKALEEEGFSVCTTTNGKTALEALRKKNAVIKLVLLDMNMPIMDGNEFLRIKSADEGIASIPVVVITATGGGPQLPVEGVFRKPIDLSALIQIAKRFVP